LLLSGGLRSAATTGCYLPAFQGEIHLLPRGVPDFHAIKTFDAALGTFLLVSM